MQLNAIDYLQKKMLKCARDYDNNPDGEPHFLCCAVAGAAPTKAASGMQPASSSRRHAAFCSPSSFFVLTLASAQQTQPSARQAVAAGMPWRTTICTFFVLTLASAQQTQPSARQAQQHVP
jgi:hypothetical protein